jgi:hypothetical protein
MTTSYNIFLPKRLCDSCGILFQRGVNPNKRMKRCDKCYRTYNKFHKRISRQKKQKNKDIEKLPSQTRLQVQKRSATEAFHEGKLTSLNIKRARLKAASYGPNFVSLALMGPGPFLEIKGFLSFEDVSALKISSRQLNTVLEPLMRKLQTDELLCLRAEKKKKERHRHQEQKLEQQEAERMHTVHSVIAHHNTPAGMLFMIRFEGPLGVPMDLLDNGATQWVRSEELQVTAPDAIDDYEQALPVYVSLPVSVYSLSLCVWVWVSLSLSLSLSHTHSACSAGGEEEEEN